jgi:hypothetical protein
MPFSIIGPVLGGLIGAGGSLLASGQQASAAQDAAQVTQNMFNTTQGNLQPWMKGGGNALNALQQALGLVPGGTGGINATGFQGSPGYQWQLGQGIGAIQNSAAAQGGIGGNTLKALQTYGTGLANQDWYNYLNQLSGLSGSGENAAANLGGFSGQAAGQTGNALLAGGAANASGTVGATNNLTGILAALSGNNNSLSSFGSSNFSPYGSTGNSYLAQQYSYGAP